MAKFNGNIFKEEFRNSEEEMKKVLYIFRNVCLKMNMKK